MLVKVQNLWWLLFLLALFSCTKNKPTDYTGGPEPPLLPQYFDHPAWHPGGQWIAAEHCDSSDVNGDGRLDQWSCGIWLVNAQSGEIKRLIDGFGLPAWSPDGKKLAMVGGSQIFTVQVTSLDSAKADTSSLKQLTFEGGNFYPAWSPDGGWVAFDRTTDSMGIWVMTSTGDGKRLIAQGRMPNWSSNGNYIIYIGFHAEIYRVNLNDTSDVVRLTSLNQIDPYAADIRLPKYSPDGQEILFYFQPRKGYPKLWIMSANGSDLRTVAKGPDWRNDWSHPDGQFIVFLHWDFLEKVPGNGQLWIINKDGSGLRQLTFYGGWHPQTGLTAW